MDRQTAHGPGAGPDRPDRSDRPAPAVPDAPAGPGAATGPGGAPDPAALQGTRFEFGGRRPLSVPPPRVTYRPPQRPLPGLGTVALGKVTRVAPYGAFVDFLGYRGLVHISQLQPGHRVERVEDVVLEGHQVVVRVIAVDPERRHINLALVPDAAGIMETIQESPPLPGASQEPAPPVVASAPDSPAAPAPRAPAEAPTAPPAARVGPPPRPPQAPQSPPSRQVSAPVLPAPSPPLPPAPPAVSPAPQAATPARPPAPSKGPPPP
ncbi:MAG TPA: S1 RNA-binding domain-containing protein, partial [Chloroflexota bacterium]|nr:S1 RNA-binding domain-containing protein [Chloroflexota bacterium]